MPRKRGITTEQYRETVAKMAEGVAHSSFDFADARILELADHLDSAVMSAVYAILPELRNHDAADAYIVRARQAFRRQLRDRVQGRPTGRDGR